MLKDRVNDTAPDGIEPELREDFVQRVKNAVSWVNRNKHAELLEYCNNQKKRARELQFLEGARTSW